MLHKSQFQIKFRGHFVLSLHGVETLKAISETAPETVEAKTAISEMKELRADLEKSKLDDVITVTKKKKLIEEISKEIGEKTLFERLHLGMSKTRDSFVGKLETIINRGRIDDDMFDEVEETLILADVGFETTNLLVNRLRKAHQEGTIKDGREIKPFLIDEITAILSQYEGSLSPISQPPYVIMMIGVNGVGKTTTIAKLAYHYLQDDKSVLLAAADTFRAGAIEQISEWSRRLEIEVVKHKSGSDPSAVAYDAVHAALARKKDALIIDTAGRLHTKVNLMEELKKIRRIVNRELEAAPQEILLVLDATNGQNAISQAKIFKQDLDVTGIVLTKLDGTAKGGIIISIVHELEIPIKFIGVGEKMYDLRPFHAREFVEALFGLEQ
ncbi:signal recognition particle-docking protein FtsY [candidate division CSSED10-310 bacterium]|uniref:Signal recognition particle receptor FtsY n=1 Tax=candidate division CSSED10-310 bacterium TaxID=2855610 RepID=A0ABV6Z1H3_UNCC1